MNKLTDQHLNAIEGLVADLSRRLRVQTEMGVLNNGTALKLEALKAALARRRHHARRVHQEPAT